MLAEFSVFLPQQEHLSPYLAEILGQLEAQGIEHTLGPTSTSLRGDSKKIFAALENCRAYLRQYCDEVMMTVQIIDRKHERHNLQSAVEAVTMQCLDE
jgi:uncharacterized protein YqgV (UPF0045/DUF77 family)